MNARFEIRLSWDFARDLDNWHIAAIIYVSCAEAARQLMGLALEHTPDTLKMSEDCYSHLTSACNVGGGEVPEEPVTRQITKSAVFGMSYKQEDNMTATKPSYYAARNGVQVWDVTRYMSGSMAQAFQYVYRAGKKDPATEIEDLQKAIAFLTDWHDNPDCVSALQANNLLCAKVDPIAVTLFPTYSWRDLCLRRIYKLDRQFRGPVTATRYMFVCREIRKRIAEINKLNGEPENV